MKNLLILLTALFIFACQSGSKEQSSSESADMQSVQLITDTLNISGMHCDMCVASIEKGVNELEGVEFVQAILDDSTTVVKYNVSVVGKEDIEKAIEKRGYSVKKDL